LPQTTREPGVKAIAINGSPRKKWNTAVLLNKALEGAGAGGAEVEIVHLYELDFKGCRSCFACKARGGPSYGKCSVDDGLTPILRKIEGATVLLVGSPIYFGSVTGEVRSFLERLLFPHVSYGSPSPTPASRQIRSGLIYTMNVKEDQARVNGYFQHLENNERVLKRCFGHAETLYSFDTYQFDDYAKVVADRFDPMLKAKRRQEVFPVDCQKSFELGSRLAREDA